MLRFPLLPDLCPMSASKESGLCFLSKHLHDAKQTGWKASSQRFGLWMAEGPAGGSVAQFSALSTDLRLNCPETVSGFRRGTRALSQRDLGFSVLESSNIMPSVTYFRQTGGPMDNFGTGGLVPEAAQREGRACCRGNSAAPPHPHPMLVQNRSLSSLLLFIFNSEGMD